MSNRDIQPYDDWFKRFFGQTGRDFFGRDMFREFNDMQRIFDQISDAQSNPQKELVRDYQIPKGNEVREVGQIVYGYSMTIGPDGNHM
jgi:HSP20 family protein